MTRRLRRRPHPRSARGVRPRVLLALVAVVVIVVSVVVVTGTGRFLVAADPLEPSDAIVVLDGATPARELAAADLWHRGLGPIVMVSHARDPLDGAARELSGLPAPQDASIRVLEHRGVPDTAIVRLSGVVDNTRQELGVALAYARAAHFRRLIIVTSPVHTRRVRIVWNAIARKRGGGDPVAAVVFGTPYDPFDVRRWWRSRRSLETTLHEWLGILHFLVGSPLPTFDPGPGGPRGGSAPGPAATSAWSVPAGTPPRASHEPSGDNTP